MSAFNVNDDHIRYLLRAEYKYSSDHSVRNRSIEDWRSIGTMLRNANIQSVNARYGESHAETRDVMCGPLVTDFDVTIGDLIDAPCTVPQALKAIDCFDYQACETDEWERTPAYEWLQSLTGAVYRHVDGYESADWEIDPSKQPRAIRAAGPRRIR